MLHISSGGHSQSTGMLKLKRFCAHKQHETGYVRVFHWRRHKTESLTFTKRTRSPFCKGQHLPVGGKVWKSKANVHKWRHRHHMIKQQSPKTWVICHKDLNVKRQSIFGTGTNNVWVPDITSWTSPAKNSSCAHFALLLPFCFFAWSDFFLWCPIVFLSPNHKSQFACP
jgi:hypothetical protein